MSSSGSSERREIEGVLERAENDERRTAEELLVGPESDQRPALSIVLPTLNEEKGIRICIDQIKHAIEALQVSAEIVVSDSSSDRTPAIAKTMGAIVVEPSERGYGHAYKHGFRAARGEYIVMGDADTTYDFKELPQLMEVARDSDLVLGSRFKGDIRPGSMPKLHKYVGNPLLTRFLNVFYGADVSDAHSGFRVISRDVLEELSLQSNGMEFASEMVMEANERGFDIVEVPITYHERKGEETLDSFRDGWRHVRFMLVNAPDHLFFGPGLLAILCGTATMFTSILDAVVGGVAFGVHTMVGGSLLTTIGCQVLFFGLFSSLAADPIREPDTELTDWVRQNFHLEHGISIGLSLVAVGGLGLGYLLMTGLSADSIGLPSPVWSILTSTTVMLGVLTIFSSFFMSILAAGNDY